MKRLAFVALLGLAGCVKGPLVSSPTAPSLPGNDSNTNTNGNNINIIIGAPTPTPTPTPTTSVA